MQIDCLVYLNVSYLKNMNTTIRFTETQRFTQWWLWLLLIGLSAVIISAMIYQITYEQPVGDNPMSDSGLIISSVIILLLNVIFFIFKLETHIDKEGIHIRFFPFHMKFRTYKWVDMSECYLRQYSPISEFGGWGIKGWPSNMAFNVSGNQGIQITFKEGKKLLIGTNSVQLTDDALKLFFLNNK